MKTCELNSLDTCLAIDLHRQWSWRTAGFVTVSQNWLQIEVYILEDKGFRKWPIELLLAVVYNYL